MPDPNALIPADTGLSVEQLMVMLTKGCWWGHVVESYNSSTPGHKQRGKLFERLHEHLTHEMERRGIDVDAVKKTLP